MKRSDQARLARRLAILGGVGVSLFGILLIGDGTLEIGRRADEQSVTAMLEERVLTDATAAPELAAVQEGHTERSVARRNRNQRLGYALLTFTVLLVAATKWNQALAPDRPPIGRQRPAPPIQHIGIARVPPPVPPEPALDLSVVDTIIAGAGASTEATIPILQALQSHYRYLPESALQRVCEHTGITPAQLLGVASFYAQFRRAPVGRHLVRVCHGTACHVAGIGAVMDELHRRLAIPPDGDTDRERRFTLESVNCLGCCSLAPVMMIGDQVAARLTPVSAWGTLQATEDGG